MLQGWCSQLMAAALVSVTLSRCHGGALKFDLLKHLAAPYSLQCSTPTCHSCPLVAPRNQSRRLAPRAHFAGRSELHQSNLGLLMLAAWQ